MNNSGNVTQWGDFAKNKSPHPTIWHYFEIKMFHPDRLLLYRVGDFFESYLGDAVQLAIVIEANLSGKQTGSSDERIAMCGFPAHALARYRRIFLEKSIKVAVVDFAQPQPANCLWHLIPRTTMLIGKADE